MISNAGTDVASRLMTAIAIGSFATAAAAVGTAIVLTGSASPAAWAAAYQHSQECTAATAAEDPNCSAAAAQEWAQRQLAAQLEQEAAQLKTKQPPVVNPPADQTAPEIPAPAPLPQAAPRPAQSDDSGEAGDD